MAILMFVIFFVLGLCLGSFLNVIIYRLPKGLDFVKGRSFCPKCKRKISWFDNIPLLSFFLLGGKCRSCQKPISWRYPFVELLTGVLTVLVFCSPRFVVEAGHQSSVFSFQTIYYLFLVWSLIPIFFIDLEHQIIPDEIIIFDVIISVFFLISQYPLSERISQSGHILISNLSVALVSAGFFLFLFLITRGKGMGLGDVKFAFLIGLVLGFPKVIPAFYLAFLTGAIVGIILILVKKAKFGRPIPFGPFLVVGMLIAMFFGEKILRFLSQMLT